MKIGQMMTKNVKTCQPTDTLEVAVGLMWEHDIGAVPIVDEVGQVIGIVTDRDACMAAFTQHRPLHDLLCSVAMAQQIVTCRADDGDVAVARVMAKNKIRRIPVVDNDHRPIGIVSLNDLALATAKSREVPATEIAVTLAAICEHRPAVPLS